MRSAHKLFNVYHEHVDGKIRVGVSRINPTTSAYTTRCYLVGAGTERDKRLGAFVNKLNNNRQIWRKHFMEYLV